MRLPSVWIIVLAIGCGHLEAPGDRSGEAESRAPVPREEGSNLETHLRRTCGPSVEESLQSTPEHDGQRPCRFEVVAQREVEHSRVREVAIVKLYAGLSWSESHHLFVRRDDWVAGPSIADGPFIGNQMVGTIHYSITDVTLRASAPGQPPSLFASFRRVELSEDDVAGDVESTSEGTLICGDFAERPRCTALRLRVSRTADDLEEVAESRLVFGEQNRLAVEPVRGGAMGQVAWFGESSIDALLEQTVWPPRPDVEPPSGASVDESDDRAAAMVVLHGDAPYAVWQVVEPIQRHPTERPPRMLAVNGARIVAGAEAGISFSYGVSRLRGSTLDVYGARGRVCRARLAGWFFLVHEYSGDAESAQGTGEAPDWERLRWDMLRLEQGMIAARLEAVEGDCADGLWARDAALGPVEMARVRPARGALLRRTLEAFRRSEAHRQLEQENGPEAEWPGGGDDQLSPRSTAVSFHLGGRNYVVLLHEAFLACVGLSAATVLFERSGTNLRELGYTQGLGRVLPAAAAAIDGDVPQLIFSDRLWHAGHSPWRYVPFADQPC